MTYLGPSLRRSARRATRPRRRVLVAIAFSLLVNALILTQLDVGWLQKPAKTLAPPRDVTLAPLSASQWAANRAIGSERARHAPAPAVAKQTTPAPSPPPPSQKMPGQVVDVAPSKNDAPPKDTRFVSERNNTVEKETRSRYARAGYENTLATPSSPKHPAASHPAPPQPTPPSTSSASAQREAGKPGAPGPLERTLPSEAPRERLALVPRGELRNPLSSPVVVPQVGGGGQGGAGGEQGATASPGPLNRFDLRPSAATFDQIAGGPAPDHLDGVEEGDGTYLNTREWKYAGYFNRIKQAVASVWDPGSSLSARDPGGARFGDRDWQTLLAIKLDANGTLKNVSVARSSGLDFLDRTAVDAFQKAQPFTNPPPGLADGSGEIAFTFGFYVQMGGSGLRIFR